jgi:flagellar basal-body rod protein FlgB
MDFGQVPIFSLMSQKMQYHSARQALIAQNIANVDTPDYVPMDIKKPDFKRNLAMAAGTVPMAKTQAGHLDGKSGGAGAFKTISQKNTFETNPNQNTISVEEEVQKMSFNQADYQQTVLMYRKTIEMFKTAIGRTGGA